MRLHLRQLVPEPRALNSSEWQGSGAQGSRWRGHLIAVHSCAVSLLQHRRLVKERLRKLA